MPEFDVLFLALLLGYLLGSIPIAALVTRRHQLDIFSIGSGQPGAANVFQNVGRRSGVLVSAGDAAKGALSVIVASRLGVEEGWVLLPAAAAIAGHWRSIFTRFRGGDGLATLLGATIALLPLHGTFAVVIGITLGFLIRRVAHPTLWAGLACYFFLLGRSLIYQEDILITLGVTMLALIVLAHIVIGHYRRKSRSIPDYETS
ncbi:MAG: hypothetical protein BZY82_09645 [SAR202 cluster bacterium Io17-Chloro-G3]|nr:MAG: hypothetical protein BZY82_09645 [SAR202 cluster bacterium Io17-Chloro-G3]